MLLVYLQRLYAPMKNIPEELFVLQGSVALSVATRGMFGLLSQLSINNWAQAFIQPRTKDKTEKFQRRVSTARWERADRGIEWRGREFGLIIDQRAPRSCFDLVKASKLAALRQDITSRGHLYAR